MGLSHKRPTKKKGMSHIRPTKKERNLKRMDIYIRSIDEGTIAKLDAKAKLLSERRGKIMSRNELIKIIIEKAMIEDFFAEEYSEINNLREKIQEYIDGNNYIIQALLTGEGQESGEEK